MLPEDTKARRAALLKKTLNQTQVDEHFESAGPCAARPEPYSNALFQEAAIQWLIETDQVCLVHDWLMIESNLMFTLTIHFIPAYSSLRTPHI